MASMIDTNEHGVYPISVTPFLESGEIDFESMDRLVDFFVTIGVPGVTILGLLGEANKLSREESLSLVKRVARRADGRFKLIVGASHAGFSELKAFTAEALAEGASGFMVPPASSLKTEDQVLAYFKAVAACIGENVPIALQDYPQSTGVTISADTLNRIITEVPGIAIVKHEEGSALRKITKLRAQEGTGGRRRVSMLVGNSGLHLPQELARGVDGANTGVAFPEMLIEVCQRYFVGERDSAEDLYDIFLPVVRHEWQPGIGLAIRKEIFRRRGLISCARARAPGPGLDHDDHAELDGLLGRLTRKLNDAGEAGLIKHYQLQQLARAA